MKVTHKEWKDFWAAIDAVPGHSVNWYEDGIPDFAVDAKDTDTIDVRYGSLIWQGRGEQIDHPLIKRDGDWLASFRAWKKSLNYRTVVVVVRKDAEDEFLELAKQHGWKVSGD